MPLVGWLRAQGLGSFESLDAFRALLAKRDVAALQSLGGALEAPDLAEVAGGDGAPLCADIARDLRNQRSPRVAALAACLKADVPTPLLGKLFGGAGDLLTDGRLGDLAEKLVSRGLPAALADPASAEVGAAAGSFARAVREARFAFGMAKVNAALSAARPGHAGVAAARLAAFGEALPPEQLAGWKAWLVKQCSGNRKAPPAARRAGLAPPWPPDLPEAFAELVKEVEAAIPISGELAPRGPAPAAAATPTTAPADLAAKPAAPAPPRQKPGIGAPIKGRPQGRPVPAADGDAPAAPAPTPAPQPKYMSPIPRPRGFVMEGAAAKARSAPGTPSGQAGTAATGDAASKTLPAMQSRFSGPHPQRDTPEPVVRGPATFKAQAAALPFLERARALCAREPDALERLCATTDVRAMLKGSLDGALAELRRDAARAAPAPDDVLARLAALAADEAAPAAWRAAAATAHEALVPRA